MKNAKALVFTVNMFDLNDHAIRFMEESDPVAIESLFGDCTTVEEINKTADELYNDFFEDVWYAVQVSSDDDWSYGSYNRDEAIEMMRRNGHGKIAVIDNKTTNPVCIKEISFGERFF